MAMQPETALHRVDHSFTSRCELAKHRHSPTRVW
jgi:hypothetical protein